MTSPAEATRERLAAIKEREAKVSSGPWCLKWIAWGIRHLNRNCDYDDSDIEGSDLHPQREEGDYDFIAHSREDIPWLLDLCASLQSELDKRRWVPAAEGPKEQGRYLVCGDPDYKGENLVGWYDDRIGWTDDLFGGALYPTHWMSLPPKPEAP